MRLLIFSLIGVVVVLFGLNFASSLLGGAMLKESHVDNDSVMVDTKGKPIMTKSGDLEVCSDSSLAKRGQCMGETATEDETVQDSTTTTKQSTTTSKPKSGPLKTMPTKQKVSLASSLPDSFFMALSEVAVFSDKGHSLKLHVHGFARVPVLNSRCGNIVHLYTAWNGRLTLDSVDLSFDPETDAHFKNAGFSLAVGGVSGRRLAGAHSVDGFFTAVQEAEGEGWNCQDVELPKVPETSITKITQYMACGVSGVTGNAMDMCDSVYGGSMPGTVTLPREHQLATMSKTARIRAGLSVDVPVEKTLFMATNIEVITSPSYELQVTTMAAHPGQQKISLFDRRTSEDIFFQIISGMVADGRFYCGSTMNDHKGNNSDGTAAKDTAQQNQKKAEQTGVDRKVHFEFLDMVEENGKMYRHFRAMTSEAFMEWMGSKKASERPKDSYYEYWDLAEDLTPYRILVPDGSLVVFEEMTRDATDADVDAKLASLGRAGWANTMSCSPKELSDGDDLAVSPTLDMAVPLISSEMQDLKSGMLNFYARMHKDDAKEGVFGSGDGRETLKKLAEGEGDMASFAKYAIRSFDSMAMPDVCSDICAHQLRNVRDDLFKDEELDVCDAPGFASLLSCMVETASRRVPVCAQAKFMVHTVGDCIKDGGAVTGTGGAGSGRRLSIRRAEDDDGGTQEYLNKIHEATFQKKAHAQSKMKQLPDGTRSLDLNDLDEDLQTSIKETLGMDSLSSARLLFNASEKDPSQLVPVLLEGTNGDLLTRRTTAVDPRSLAGIEIKCTAPGVGPGCIFALGWPIGCYPWLASGPKSCDYGLNIHIHRGGEYDGLLSVSAIGCWTLLQFTPPIPKPFDGSICVGGNIKFLKKSLCPDMKFALSGSVYVIASFGFDLGILSFTLQEMRLDLGAEVAKRNGDICDARRRRRAGGRRRRVHCNQVCDIRVYAKITLTILMFRAWIQADYWVKAKDWDITVGADVYIWLIFKAWWKNIASIKLI